MKTADEIVEDLKKQGHRMTAARYFLLSFLVNCRKPVTAAQLVKHVSIPVRSLSRATVYRELDFLKTQGLIREIDLNESKKRYEFTGLPHHHHVVCLECDKVEDVVVEDDVKKIEQKIKRSKNFIVNKHSLEFFGVCAECA